LRLVEQKRAAINPEEGFHYTPEQLRAYATDGGSPKMDGNYTIFAQVIEGLDVIDRIAALPCDGRDRPLTDVRLWMRELK
ncbi:MAG TPA: peptidylprolyl isomerase, partial [Flavobacteriales bacterium]|nr:peptidylprolyl isomerase [Flavobacteriales bacterium]